MDVLGKLALIVGFVCALCIAGLVLLAYSAPRHEGAMLCLAFLALVTGGVLTGWLSAVLLWCRHGGCQQGTEREDGNAAAPPPTDEEAESDRHDRLWQS